MIQSTAHRPSDRPTWALLQRQLFEASADACRVMSATYSEGDGRLIFDPDRLAGMRGDRDGVDDFYESFGNWPQLYLLGGRAEVLEAAKRHWSGITAQLTEAGMLHEEFERHYDWFHQGESLELFAFICLADPTDADFRARALRFARFYTDPQYGNFDPSTMIIVAPHNGSLGATRGFLDSDPHFPWSPVFINYGLPLDWVGVDTIEQAFEDQASGDLLGQEMWDRMSRGDTAVNLAVTSLVLNAYLLTGEAALADWVGAYTRRWAELVRPEDGLLPDTIGLSGAAGEHLEGRWYGGHYGWAWPHGLHSVGTALLVAVANAQLLSETTPLLAVARSTLDAVIAQRRVMDPADADMSMPGRWTQRFTDGRPSALVPYRHNDSGWFDFMPMQAALPTALWHLTMDDADLARLKLLESESSYAWSEYFDVRDKEDAGHEEPWLAFLWGNNPHYPEQALTAALAECRRRVDLIQADDPLVVTHIHHWQNLNPVSTEALTQLTLGAPQTLYNGGLLQARVRYWDAAERRPGLPADVAALVRSIAWDATTVELHNLGEEERLVVLQAGAMAEHAVVGVTVDGRVLPRPIATEASAVVQLAMPAGTTVTVVLELEPRRLPPTYRAPWADRSIHAPVPVGSGE